MPADLAGDERSDRESAERRTEETVYEVRRISKSLARWRFASALNLSLLFLSEIHRWQVAGRKCAGGARYSGLTKVEKD